MAYRRALSTKGLRPIPSQPEAAMLRLLSSVNSPSSLSSGRSCALTYGGSRTARCASVRPSYHEDGHACADISCTHAQQISETRMVQTNGSSFVGNFCEYLPVLPYARSRKGADHLHGPSSRESIETAQSGAGSLPSMAMCHASLPGRSVVPSQQVNQ